jgi:hypothetical protein
MIQIGYEQLKSERARAAAFPSMRYTEAEALWAKLSAMQNLQLLLFGPLKVGEVTFTHDDEPDTKMDLHLWRCENGHATLNYQNGMPGYNLRVQCHCNNCHYYSRLRYRLSSVASLMRMAVLLLSRKRSRVPPAS